MGGIDLTKGRYDDRNHPLFSTNHTVHANDFYQGCIENPDAAKGASFSPLPHPFPRSLPKLHEPTYGMTGVQIATGGVRV